MRNELVAHRQGGKSPRLRSMLTTGILLLLPFFGCRSITIRVPAYSVSPAAAPTSFIAGHARVDITPAPGYPTGGHSIAGKVARGYWTRLHARAFYFQDVTGAPLALVSCDLFAIPAGLHARVAFRLSKRGLTPTSIILAATHTHHGPGNYLTSTVYNGFASLWGGFDQTLFDFLENRITQAVEEAIASARSSETTPVTLRLYAGATTGLTRNRSVKAFERNSRSLQEEILGAGPPPSPSCPGPCIRYRATNPELLILEVARATGQPRSLLVFSGVHPTAMPHHAALYHADLAGVAMEQLERATPGVIAGFFNGAEGDVSPRWEHQDRENTLRLGGQLAEDVRNLLRSPPITMDQDPRVTVRRANLPRRQFCPPGSKDPEFGAAALGGAEDGRTFLHDLGWRAGVTGPRRHDGHGIKLPALDVKELSFLRLTRLLNPASNFPNAVPIGLAHIGPLTLASLPVEITTAAGWQIRKKLATPEGSRRLGIVGLANEYLSYVTTREEYEEQDYEGASTIMGEDSATCFAHALVALAQASPPPAERDIPAIRFRAGPKPVKLRFGPEFLPLFRGPGDEEFTQVFRTTGTPAHAWPRFAWSEPPSTDWKTADRRVSLERDKDGSWTPAEEFSQDLLTLVTGASGTAREWLVVWIAPANPLGNRFRFRVKTPDGRTLFSEPLAGQELSRDLP